MSLNHVLLTRFNVPTRGTEKIIRASADWLANRFTLFEQFCLPSVRAQTVQKFHWVLYFDVETPPAYKERALSLIKPMPNASIRFGGPDDFPPRSIEQDIRDGAASPSDWVVTTRLDNDDAISRDFIARVQAHARPGTREVLNIPNGFTWFRGRVYSHYHPSNAFASFSEDPAAFKSILSVSHMELGTVAPIRQIAGDGAWLQVIHGQNVSNRVRGVLTDAGTVRSRFGLAENTELSDPRMRELALDRLLLYPARYGRDMTIQAAKLLRKARPGRVAKGTA